MSSNGQPGSPPVIVRRNHGRGHSYYVDDVKLPGATKVLGDGFPKFLESWAARSSADYAVNNWDDLAALPITERRDLIERARYDDRDAAARRGQEVHDYALRRLAGDDEVEVPDELVGHVDAYLAFVDDWNPRELFVEATVANVRRGYCGTLDVIAELADGRTWLYDLKTTRSGVFVEAALQVTAYRYAEFLLDADGSVQAMVDVDACGVLWLKGDGSYEFVEVAAGEPEFVVFLYALGIARFRERDDVLLEVNTGPPVRVYDL